MAQHDLPIQPDEEQMILSEEITQPDQTTASNYPDIPNDLFGRNDGTRSNYETTDPIESIDPKLSK